MSRIDGIKVHSGYLSYECTFFIYRNNDFVFARIKNFKKMILMMKAQGISL